MLKIMRTALLIICSMQLFMRASDDFNDKVEAIVNTIKAIQKETRIVPANPTDTDSEFTTCIQKTIPNYNKVFYGKGAGSVLKTGPLGDITIQVPEEDQKRFTFAEKGKIQLPLLFDSALANNNRFDRFYTDPFQKKRTAQHKKQIQPSNHPMNMFMPGQEDNAIKNYKALIAAIMLGLFLENIEDPTLLIEATNSSIIAAAIYQAYIGQTETSKVYVCDNTHQTLIETIKNSAQKKLSDVLTETTKQLMLTELKMGDSVHKLSTPDYNEAKSFWLSQGYAQENSHGTATPKTVYVPKSAHSSVEQTPIQKKIVGQLEAYEKSIKN